MHNTNLSNVRNSKRSLQTFGMFAIILLMAVSATWWFTRNYYNHNEVTDSAFLRLDSSLNNCNRLIQNSNRDIVNEMDEKLSDPARREKALLWRPKVKSVLILTKNTQQYIQEIKNGLKDANEYRESNSDNSSFYKSKVINILFDSLNSFNSYLIDLIPKNQIRQQSMLPPQVLISDSQFNNKQAWKESYFKHLSINATIAMLSKMESDILRSANMVLYYMNNQNESLIHYCEFYIPLVTQNSTCLLPGQMLEITAGIGSYTTMIIPSIAIDNKKITFTENGVGVYKKIIRVGKGGSIPIVITYKDPNTGQIMTVSKNINYSVFQPTKQ